MRSVARVAAVFVLTLVGVAALLVGGTLTILQTGWGSDLARRLALPRVNAAIAGRLDVARFAFGGDHVTLEGVVLRAPEGEVVARVREITVAFAPLSLLRGHVAISEARIVAPELMLRTERGDLNLARAVAPRSPGVAPPARASSAPSSGGIVVDIADLLVSDGALDYRSAGDGTGTERPSEVKAATISVRGRAHYDAGPAVFAVGLTAGAAFSEPLAAPLTLRVNADGRGARRDVSVTMTVGDTAIAATLDMDGADRVTARVSHAHIAPALVRALAPAVRLRVPLDVDADVARAGPSVTLTAGVHSTAGTLAVRGQGDLMTARAQSLAISARDIDLGALIEGLPSSSLSLSVDGEGGGRDLRALEGRLSLELPAGRLGGEPVGPLTLRLNATPGRYELEQLRVVLPGLIATGQGQVGPVALAAHLEIVASDLRRTARAASTLRDLGIPALVGRGRVDVSVNGTLAAPDLRVAAAVPRLVVGDDVVQGSSLHAHFLDARQPDRGTVDLHVASVRIAGHAARDVVVQGSSTARRLALAAHVAGALPLSLAVDGTWGADRRSLDVDRLDVHYARASWTLTHRALFVVRPNHLEIAGLEMSAREQRLRVDFEERGDRLRGKLALEALDLGALPAQLARPGLTVGGRLDVHASIGGTTSRPRGQAAVVLRDGAFDRYRNLALRLDGRYDERRTSGTLAATGLAASIDADFDLPTTWPLRRDGVPLRLNVTIPPVDLAALRRAVDLPIARPLAGKVRLSLALRGTSSEPDLMLDGAATDLVIDGQPLGAVSLTAVANRATPLTVSLDVHGDDTTSAKGSPAPIVCSGTMKVSTDLALASLAKTPPTLRVLARTHFDVMGDLRAIPLGTLARLVGSGAVSGGAASVRVSATGTALAPRGALNLQVVGATGPRFPPTDARLDAAFGARDVRVAVRVLRGPRELASASGALTLPARDLRDQTALAAAPLTLRVAVGPLQVQRSDVVGTAVVALPSTLSAKIAAALSVDGSLSRPTLSATLKLDDARLGDAPLGDARAKVTYEAGRAGLEVVAQAATGGALRVAGRTRVDLGWPQVAQGVVVGELPLDLTLAADRFDLAWLSGLSEDVRSVRGHLSGAVAATGKLERPWVSGKLEWTGGALGLTGLGSYHDVHLAMHGDPHALWLDDLRVASGEGNAHVTASATRTGDRGYAVTSFLSLSRFPIYGQGQALAVLSADGSAMGDVASDGAKGTLQLKDAHVELTDAKQKDLQPLGRPSDVILMSDGTPVDRAEAAKLALVDAALTDTPPHPAGAGKIAPPPESVPFAVHVGIDAPRNLWVHGKDAALELGLGPNFRVTSMGRTRIYGDVEVRRGRIDVLGRRFDLQAGSVLHFAGAPEAPRLDVSATYVNETENITVILTAKGALDHLTIAVSSPDRPDLTEGQLYTLIVTGRLQLGGNTAGSASASGEAASIVGGLVASQLQKTLAKRLPLDVLTLQAGQGLEGSRLEAGTYVTTKLYAGYVGRVGANPALLQNRNAVHLEYQLSRRWSFDGEYGDVGTGTADLMWTKNY